MILVTGGGGFIGGHLVRALNARGADVRAADIKPLDDWWQVVPGADVVAGVDLRDQDTCLWTTLGCSTVYHLAADMGGMGFIHQAECEIMRNNALMNLNMIDAVARNAVPRYFFASSVCVYADMNRDDDVVNEDGAYPARPDNEYGWEKLYAERTAMAFSRRYGVEVRIARFQNCYGPFGTWSGGREKAPAALCRKVATVADGGTIEVWGDGTAVRSYTYVDDMVDGILRLTASALEGPVNIGNPEYVSVDQLVGIIADVAGKRVLIEHVDGPVGVASRNFSNDRIQSTGWRAKTSTHAGIARTYPWIDQEVRARMGVAI